MLQQPLSTEYASSFSKYVDLVPQSDLYDHLQNQLEEVSQLTARLTDEQLMYRYDEGKWSLKEVLGHIIDAERVFSYRLLRIARGDQTPLAGFNEEDYVEGSRYDQCPISDILEEYEAVRRATLSLARGLSDEAWFRLGYANDCEISARALLFLIAGHELHHLQIIRERYLPNNLA